MLAAGVVKATQNKTHPYMVVLPVDADCKHHVAFFVADQEKIPWYQRRNMDNGEPMAGVFEFDPADQFAHFVPMDELIREK